MTKHDILFGVHPPAPPTGNDDEDEETDENE